MKCSIHHTHLFASDIDASIAFYEKYFDGQVVLDMDLAGARNVGMKVGSGRIHFYDQGPKDAFRGPIHHIGIQTNDLQGLVERMKAGGVNFKKEISDFGFWKYVIAPAPDGVLLELFEVSQEQIPETHRHFFSLE